MINEFLEMSETLASIDIKSTPNYKAYLAFKDAFAKRGIPLALLGSLKIEVNEDFFEDSEISEKIIENMTVCFEKIYKALKEDFGDNTGNVIFSEWIKSMSLAYS